MCLLLGCTTKANINLPTKQKTVLAGSTELPKGIEELDFNRPILLGKIHGTNEIPLMVAKLTEHLSQHEPVTIALELPEDSWVREYISSDGSPAARAKLLQTSFWNRKFQTGRSSEGVFLLLESLRELHANGRDIDLVLFDLPLDTPNRDQAMAEVLLTKIKETKNTIIITGNVHSRVTKGFPGNPEYMPMGATLAKEWDVMALDISYGEGTGWQCRRKTGCGIYEMKGTFRGKESFVTFDIRPAANGHHGQIYIPVVSASPPAVQSRDLPK